jgi:Ni,Fe-hydrogenase III small subunit/formate hydrogenlyase subunit 6/NADH:ubiquinone oxidoreductase subunit I
MFHIFKKAAKTGLVTIGYPQKSAVIPENFRGAPRFNFSAWRDARPAAEACPTGAIEIEESGHRRRVKIDYGLCIYCGQCAEADGSDAIEITRDFELAAGERGDLVMTAEYPLEADGSQGQLEGLHKGAPSLDKSREDLKRKDLERKLQQRIQGVLGRSLAIREVDAGSCNGCEIEIAALNNPVYDLERLGIHFVASPRHADMLLVTGPVTRNMETALLKTYRATPEPKIVVAVGACGISGGIFGTNYATVGGVDAVVPVDVFIPGCPPRPHALLHGILLALGRMEQRRFSGQSMSAELE